VDALVLEVHGLVHDQGWLADRALERVVRRERKLWASERRLVAESTYALIRAQGQLDFLLAGVLPGEKAAGVDLATRYAAWLVSAGGATRAQVSGRLAVPASALAGLEGGHARLGALSDPLDRLAVEESLPRWIAARLVEELGAREAKALAAAMNTRAPLTVRTNLLVIERDALRARLEGEGVAAEPTRFSPWGLVLDGHQNAFALPSFREGAFEIQDEGSQLIALACGARPGWTVVDACSGAGGKALALAMEMRNKGSLHALDTDADRLDDARRRARRAHVHNLRAQVIPADAAAEAALSPLSGKARVVLIDAPCSGLGTLRRKPDARWRLTPADPERFAALQRTLLSRFAALAEPGGRVVYATCAIGRVENDDVADFAERELDLAPAPLAATLGEERLRALDGAGSRLSLYPHRHGTDGFFMAAFEKRKP
jgi:16S rRNA (cytosine967-C5)-methyltransferase